MQIIQSLQVGLRRNWKCDCSMKMCCLYTSCSNDNRAAVCLCFRVLWTHLLYLFNFVFSSSLFPFPLLLWNFKWDVGTLNVWSTSLHPWTLLPLVGPLLLRCGDPKLLRLLGWAQGMSQKALVLGSTGGYCSWDPGWNIFWHESSFPSGEKRGFPCCRAMCQLCWYVGMSQMEGSQTDWHCEMLKFLGYLCSKNRLQLPCNCP